MSHMPRFAVVAMLVAACGGGGSSSGSADDGTYAIVDVNIVDVELGVTVRGQTVVVAGDRIERIGDSAEVEVPGGADTIDGQGRYLMPGLVDAHVHFFDAPVFGRTMLANGVLLVRDMAMPTDEVVELRDELDSGALLGPEMRATGLVLDGDPPFFPELSLAVDTVEEGRAAVRQQADAGVDMIKVYTVLDADVFLAIVDEAETLGLKVVGHVPESISVEDAAVAGLASSEHLFGFDKLVGTLLGEPLDLSYRGIGADAGYLLRLDEVDRAEMAAVFERLRDSGLTVCPTVVTFQVGARLNAIRAGDFAGNEYISQTVLDIWESQWAEQVELPDAIWQNWAEVVQQLNAAGVPLMVGTDLLAPGIIPGFDIHQEMAIWQDTGIAPADVLRSATIVPARFMGLDDRLGTIAEGKSASMVLVGANPLDDVGNAAAIEAVFLRGQYFDADDLGVMLAEAREIAASSRS